MDEHINRTILANFTNNCVNGEINKSDNQQNVVKLENGNMQYINMSRESEYIDHTLLGPEYIGNTISIIDLIEQQDTAGQTSSVCQIPSLSTNETFPSESHLHTILQYGGRTGSIRPQTNISNDNPSDHLMHSDKTILDAEFLGIHGNLFCGQQNVSTHGTLTQELTAPTLQTLSNHSNSFSSLRWMKKENYHTTLPEIPELVGPLATVTKKVLPHKKRISKKLKILNDEKPSHSDRTAISNGSQFECELCGSISESQMQFFSHLKGHYEPNSLVEPKTENIQEASIAITANPPVIEKVQVQPPTIVSDQVFNDVELNFDSFSDVVGLSSQHQHSANEETNRRNMEYVNSTQSCNVQFTKDEVEFSDTEDMLEGIRGVVDKVSVDDTSNDLDMRGISVSKDHWFANANFNGLTFKETVNVPEPINSVTELTSLQSLGNRAKTNSNKLPVNPSCKDFANIRQQSGSNINNLSQQQQNSVGSKEKHKPGRPKCAKNKSKPLRSKAKDPNFEGDELTDIEESTKKQYICSKCNRVFNSCNALKYHDLSHTGERAYQCSVCGKSFFAQSALTSHSRLHTGDKPFECDKCHRKFRQWSDLKYHEASIHSDERNFQCEFCGKSFSRKYSLVLHRRIHTRESNYKCEFCPKSFRASSYLQNHRKIHTGERPYQCKICEKKFRVCGDLKRHQKTHNRKPKDTRELKIADTYSIENGKADLMLESSSQKDSKDGILLLDKVATKIENLFKTAEPFVGTDITNNHLSFEP